MFGENFGPVFFVFTNVLFLVLGGVQVYIGIELLLDDQLNAFSYNGMSNGIASCGVLILLVSILGCCGSRWNSKLVVLPYSTLIVVSIAAQSVLAYFMLNTHASISSIVSNMYSTGVTPASQAVFQWFKNQFNANYAKCNPFISFVNIPPKNNIHLNCMDDSMKWFDQFINEFCFIRPQDLLPGSTFLQCAGSNYENKNTVGKVALFCSCERKLFSWVDDQILLIGCISALIAAFLALLIVLACFVMCSKNHRHRRYQEIKMPVKENLYPVNDRRSYYYQRDDSQRNYGQPNLNEQHLTDNRNRYAASQNYMTPVDSIPYAQPVDYGSPLLKKT